MVDKLNKILVFVGLTWLTPVIKLAAGENPSQQVRDIWTLIGVPVSAFVSFLMLWSLTAAQIETSLGNIPGPMQAYQQAVGLWEEHVEEREKARAFYKRQQKRNAEKLAANPQAQVKIRQYTGKPTYLDQIGTSLYTVFAGFSLAALVAVPIGLFCGMSRTMMNAFNPLIQIFKPVSPLAWLPLVTMVVSALYTTNDGLFAKSFINSAVTVSLCSLWPALINTALGVSSLSQDYVNVARVLNLGVKDRIFKIVLPASLPYIFTGLRISLGVGWMVLIAAEMLAQNPGLGKFVWDEFQNGSSHSLARILVAVLTIGFIGFMLDQAMVILHKLVSFGDERTEVLANVSLEIERGEFVAIVGFSGSGKTTLISLIAGLIEPDEGEILINGKRIAGPGPERGVIFQNYSLLPWLTVYGNVALVVNHLFPAWPAKKRRAHVKRYVEMVHLTPALQKRPTELSGGMRQRVAVARALAMDPEILLMDEPLSALDALTRGTLQAEIEKIWREERKTAVLITNDVDEGLVLADRIIPLRPGAASLGTTLGPHFPVELDRPRDRTELNSDVGYKVVRNAVNSYLLEVRPDQGLAQHARFKELALPNIEPVELSK